MKELLIVILFAGVCFSTSFAADNSNGQQQAGPNFEARKSLILNHIDERIATLQGMRDCVKSAQSRDDMKTCREKYAPKGKSRQGQNDGQNPGGE